MNDSLRFPAVLLSVLIFYIIFESLCSLQSKTAGLDFNGPDYGSYVGRVVEINDHEYSFSFVPQKQIQQAEGSDEEYVYGYCGNPDEDPEIRIAEELRGAARLETIIHELLHASDWKTLSEEYVTETAEDVARVLYQLGYRVEGESVFVK